MSQPRTAPLKLRFLIVGGGIGGLASAFALSQAGHYVHVIEKADSLDQTAAGIRVPPNLTRLLVRWGLGPQFFKSAIKSDRLSFRSLRSEQWVGSLEYKEEVMKVLGADFFLMHYSDLVAMMYKLAIDAGAVVQFSTTVTHIDPTIPTATLSTGEVIRPDLIVGADGYQSLARRTIEDDTGESNIGVPSGTVVYTVSVPTEGLENEPSLANVLRAKEWTAYMGEYISVLMHPMRDFKEFSIQLFMPDKTTDSEETWDRTVSVDCIDQEKFGPGLRKLMSRAKVALETRFMKRSIIEEWVHSSGRVVLLGEAAHPQIPSSTHSGSLAVEDAAVLADLFSRLRKHDQIEQFLHAYQELRQERCWEIQQSEANNSASVMLPDGPEQAARDESMRQAAAMNTGGWDEDSFRHLWERIRVLFSYDPEEEVEEWWQQWGLLRERADSISSIASDSTAAHVPLHVTVDTESTTQETQ